MSSILTIDSAFESEKLDASSILRLQIHTSISKIMQLKINNPKLTQEEIAKQMGISDSTIKR